MVDIARDREEKMINKVDGRGTTKMRKGGNRNKGERVREWMEKRRTEKKRGRGRASKVALKLLQIGH